MHQHIHDDDYHVDSVERFLESVRVERVHDLRTDEGAVDVEIDPMGFGGCYAFTARSERASGFFDKADEMEWAEIEPDGRIMSGAHSSDTWDTLGMFTRGGLNVCWHPGDGEWRPVRYVPAFGSIGDEMIGIGEGRHGDFRRAEKGV